MNKKIAFFISAWYFGGAEKVVIRLANQFITKGYDVCVVVCHKSENSAMPVNEGYKNELHSGVEFTFLDIEAPAFIKSTKLRFYIEVLLRIPHIAKYIIREKPFAIFSNNIGASAIIANLFSLGKTKIIPVEHNSYTIRTGKAKTAMRFFYPFASSIVCVSKDMEKELRGQMPCIKEKIISIPNPIDLAEIHGKATQPTRHPWLEEPKTLPVFLGIGRLHPQKNFELLLRAFALVREQREGKLIIAGIGKQESYLKNLAMELGIETHVDFVGFLENPYPFFREADVFVLSSIHEGFGLVLAEALACGCQVVSTDCPVGPSEILENGKYGWLIPMNNPAAMANAMLEAIAHPKAKELLYERGRDFSDDRTAEKYAGLLRKAR
ncbi:glycosyltransferase [Synergistaceae bacterium OttesenSCG-928-D05]|nr:glycosyltransferase [Synergistaceae bacterium OttesenSCG-928-D05]